jgi:5-methylcytosine-specific restriction enzyme subunit McrC
MSIPIANLYYLLSYASDILPITGYTSVGVVPTVKVQNLFARLLIDETTSLVRKGLDQGYLEESYSSSIIRGRVDFQDSIRKGSLVRRMVTITVAELTHDVLHNQILKTTLLNLASVKDLDSDLKTQLISISRCLPDVCQIVLSEKIFRQVQLNAHISEYRFILDVCAIVFDSLLPDEASGTYRFRDFLRDERAMARLWEKFLLNFYRRHAVGFQVHSKHMFWNGYSDMSSLLPQLRTDVWLENADKIIIVDAKYYVTTLVRDRSSSRLKLKSEHVNQMFVYMSNAKLHASLTKSVSGVLLYPMVDDAVATKEQLIDFTLLARTIDLRSSWNQIERDLLSVVGL